MKRFPYPVIVDTDIGDDVDDTWALALMLASGAFDIRLIVVSNNDTEYKARLTAKILTALGRADIPIAIGNSTPLPPNYVWGQGKWLNGFSLTSYAGRVTRGIDEAARIILESDRRVCLFALGTNRTPADLVARYPTVVRNSFIYAMAGAVRKSYEGVDRVVPEFNIASDLSASQAVFDSGWAYTMLPLDVCADLRLEGSLYAAFLQSNAPCARLVKDNYKAWLEDAIFENKNTFEKGSSILFDLVVPWYALFPQHFIVRSEPVYIDAAGITKTGRGGVKNWAAEITDTDALFRYTVDCLCRE